MLLDLGVRFTVTPVYDAQAGNRPYLRADGDTDLTRAQVRLRGFIRFKSRRS
jgi:hypothetical protein